MGRISIYKLTAPNGKIYIGQTNKINRRFGSYRRCECKAQTKLYNSIKKYGWENFNKEIVWNTNTENADKAERFFIALFDTVENGLNCEYGGNKNKTLSQKTRRKLSKNNSHYWKGKKFTERAKQRMRENHVGNTGRKLTPIHKKKLSEAISGDKNYWFGKKHTEDTKLKLRNSHLGKKHSEETKEKMKISQRNRRKNENKN